MLNIIGGLFSWITGNSKSADNAMSAIDKMVFTDEEKSEFDEKARDKILDFKIEYARVTQSQSIARRVVALAFTFTFLLLVLAAVVSGYFNSAADSYAAFVFAVIKEHLLTPIQFIIGFYFAPHAIKQLRK